MTAELGAWSALPSVIIVAWTFATKRILEALTIGTLVGLVMVSATPAAALAEYPKVLQKALMSEDIAWLIVVCGLMGSLITLLRVSGGALAFGNWVAQRVKSARSALGWSWLLGCVIFIDDYLNSMTVGSSMARVTDRYRVPREMLAYVADSTAAPLCVIVPFTTWAAFAGRVIQRSGWTEPGLSELDIFCKTIPYNLYGWLAALVVPLVIWGVIPHLGGMRSAYKRVEAGGPLAPEGSERISLLPNDKGEKAEELKSGKKPRLWNFLLPIAVLIGATIVFDNDLAKGVLTALPFTYLLFICQRVVSPRDAWDAIVEGFRDLILPLMLMVFAFVFADVNERLGFVKWAISAGDSFMTAATAPAIVFIILAITEFVTGTNWGMYVIALPIVIPLARTLHVDLPLMVAACLSAGVFGSHVSFCSDATVITSAACGCDNYRHAITQLPYGLLAAAFSLIGFLILGFCMA